MRIKKEAFAFAVLFLIIFNLFFVRVNAEVTLHENSSTIENSYGEGDFVKGRVNMSFTDEENNKFTSNFNGGIKFYDLLKNLSVSFTCNPKNCKDTYSYSNEEASKSFSIVNDKYIGMIISGGKLNSIEGFKFNLTDRSGGQSSCNNQINVDLFDDGTLDFYNNINSGEVCERKPKSDGCFEDDEPSSMSEIREKLYCNRANLTIAPGYRISAMVKKMAVNTDKISFYLFDAGNLRGMKSIPCELVPDMAVGDTKEVGCNINVSLNKNFDGIFCIQDASNTGDKSAFQIKSESHDACGGTITNPSSATFNKNNDFEIFIQPLKYAPLTNVLFDPIKYQDFKGRNADLKADIKNYINQTYGNDCSDNCIIPIYLNGSLTNVGIYGLRIAYNTEISSTTERLYDLSNKPFTISMNNTFLDMEKMKFMVPNVNGSHNFYLCFNEDNNCDDDNSLISKKINVLVGFSFGVGPRSALVGQKIYFIAQTAQSNKNISSTVWNFGDETPTVSSSDNKAEHTYREEKEFIIEVTAKTKTGESSTKKFKIVVGDTKKSINFTISKYKKRISEADNSIRAMPEWIKNDILEYLKPDRDEFTKISNDYIKLGNNANISEYSAILTRLLDLKIPYSIRTSEKASNIPIIAGYDNINVNYIKERSGDSDNEGEKSDESLSLKEGIISWSYKNFDTKIDYETISGNYEEEIENIRRIFTINLNRKDDAEDVDSYLVINYPPSSIKFKEDYGIENSKGESAVFIKLDKESPETIQFMIKGEELPSFEQLGMYISPEIRDLEVAKPIEENLFRKVVDFLWNRFLTGIIPLIIGVIVVYILLQQWYKKNYEKHLFKNPDDLYNLINFIYNSRRIGMNDKDIRKKLEEKKWKGEQLTYALKKIDGKRTGMFEIPIFKFAENKRVKQEIEKRQKGPVDTRFIKMKK